MGRGEYPPVTPPDVETPETPEIPPVPETPPTPETPPSPDMPVATNTVPKTGDANGAVVPLVAVLLSGLGVYILFAKSEKKEKALK